MLLDQKTDWGIEPYNHVPEHLQEQLPKSIVPMWRLHESEEAKKLAELCRRAFTPYLLSDGWLSSREFIDNPYRSLEPLSICLLNHSLYVSIYYY